MDRDHDLNPALRPLPQQEPTPAVLVLEPARSEGNVDETVVEVELPELLQLLRELVFGIDLPAGRDDRAEPRWNLAREGEPGILAVLHSRSKPPLGEDLRPFEPDLPDSDDVLLSQVEHHRHAGVVESLPFDFDVPLGEALVHQEDPDDLRRPQGSRGVVERSGRDLGLLLPKLLLDRGRVERIGTRELDSLDPRALSDEERQQLALLSVSHLQRQVVEKARLP